MVAWCGADYKGGEHDLFYPMDGETEWINLDGEKWYPLLPDEEQARIEAEINALIKDRKALGKATMPRL